MNLIFLWTLLPLVVSANHEPSDAEKAEISSGARREAAILKYASKRFKYADFPTFPARKYLDLFQATKAHVLRRWILHIKEAEKFDDTDFWTVMFKYAYCQNENKEECTTKIMEFMNHLDYNNITVDHMRHIPQNQAYCEKESCSTLCEKDCSSICKELCTIRMSSADSKKYEDERQRFLTELDKLTGEYVQKEIERIVRILEYALKNMKFVDYSIFPAKKYFEEHIRANQTSDEEAATLALQFDYCNSEDKNACMAKISDFLKHVEIDQMRALRPNDMRESPKDQADCEKRCSIFCKDDCANNCKELCEIRMSSPENKNYEEERIKFFNEFAKLNVEFTKKEGPLT